MTVGAEPRELAPVVPDVSLWWCDLALGDADVEPVAATLSPNEHARAARFGTDALRQRWIAGRASLRIVLGLALRMPPAEVPIVRGARGRPELRGADAGLDFNISHTDGIVLIGLRRTKGRVRALA
jgi:4'-phosphopantetheinyl transferase